MTRRAFPITPLTLVLTLVLSACGGANRDDNPVSEGEEAALEEAAKMLDQKRLPEGALPVATPVSGPSETSDSATR